MTEESSSLPISQAPDFSDRVDALLSSALADQAREKRQLVDTLYGAKAALVKAEEEIAGLREQIGKRDEELLQAIDKRFEARIEAVEEALIKLAKSIAQVPAKVRMDIETAAVAMGDRMGEESDSLLRNTREDAVEVVGTIGKLSDRTLTQTREAIEAAREEYRTTTEQMVRYLGERDDALQRQRDQVLVDLFRQLGESLGRRNSKKVAKAIAEDRSIGRRPQAPPGQQPPAPPPYRQAPIYRPPAPGQLAPGTSIVSPSEPIEPPRFGPQPGVPELEVPEETETIDRPRAAAQPIANPLTKTEPPRDYLVRVPAYDTKHGKSDSDEAAGRIFGPIVPDQESKPRRSRRKAQEPPPPKVAKPPKAPSSRAPRRRP
jgi:hypothetical protein